MFIDRIDVKLFLSCDPILEGTKAKNFLKSLITLWSMIILNKKTVWMYVRSSYGQYGGLHNKFN